MNGVVKGLSGTGGWFRPAACCVRHVVRSDAVHAGCVTRCGQTRCMLGASRDCTLACRLYCTQDATACTLAAFSHWLLGTLHGSVATYPGYATQFTVVTSRIASLLEQGLVALQRPSEQRTRRQIDVEDHAIVDWICTWIRRGTQRMTLLA